MFSDRRNTRIKSVIFQSCVDICTAISWSVIFWSYVLNRPPYRRMLHLRVSLASCVTSPWRPCSQTTKPKWFTIVGNERCVNEHFNFRPRCSLNALSYTPLFHLQQFSFPVCSMRRVCTTGRLHVHGVGRESNRLLARSLIRSKQVLKVI